MRCVPITTARSSPTCSTTNLKDKTDIIFSKFLFAEVMTRGLGELTMN